MTDLDDLAQHLRRLPGVLAKADIGLVAETLGAGDWYAGPGDDGAVLPPGDGHVVVGGEAILPAFVEADPYGAGVAAVLANVNDLAAMGARPVALLDTVVGTEAVSREILRGMRWAGQLYDVPVVGGHLTRTEGPPSLSAFGVGRADRVLSARNAAAGQQLLIGCCVEGTMRSDFLFFPSFDERGRSPRRRRPAARRAGHRRPRGRRQGRQHGRTGRLAGHAARAEPARGEPRPGRASGARRGVPRRLAVVLPVLRVPADLPTAAGRALPRGVRRAGPDRRGARGDRRHRPRPPAPGHRDGGRVRPPPGRV